MEKMVVYQALYGEGEMWVRPYEMFFGTVERDGKVMQRFTKITEEESHEYYEYETKVSGRPNCPLCSTPHYLAAASLQYLLANSWCDLQCPWDTQHGPLLPGRRKEQETMTLPEAIVYLLA